MRIARLLATFLLVFTCFVTPAFAEMGVPSLPTPGGFSVTPSVGTDFTVGGDFVKSGSQSVTGSGTAFGVTVSGTGTLAVNRLSFNDVYGAPVQIGLSGNYGLTNNDEISAKVHWLHAGGKTVDAGSASFAGTINGVGVTAGGNFQGKFSDYNEHGIDGEYKHFFDTSFSSFHPYLGGALGAAHTGQVNVDVSAGGTAIVNGVHFYGSSWIFTTGLEAGFRFDVAPSVAVGLETGIKYSGDLNRDNTNLSGTGGLSNINNGGSRWDIPVVFGVTAKF